jgi:hypothetical protein
MTTRDGLVELIHLESRTPLIRSERICQVKSLKHSRSYVRRMTMMQFFGIFQTSRGFIERALNGSCMGLHTLVVSTLI